LAPDDVWLSVADPEAKDAVEELDAAVVAWGVLRFSRPAVMVTLKYSGGLVGDSLTPELVSV
jgi:hypothetical protein